MAQLAFRAKLLHAKLLWFGAWGTPLEQSANNMRALQMYEDLVLGSTFKSTVPGPGSGQPAHPDKLKAIVDWVEVKTKMKRISRGDLSQVRVVLQRTIDVYEYQSKPRSAQSARLALARAIFAVYKLSFQLEHDTWHEQPQLLAEAQHKLEEAHSLLSHVEAWAVMELGGATCHPL